MAIQLLKSKNVVSHFRSKLGFLAITNQPTCWNPFFTQKIHTCSRTITQNLESPHEFSCKNPNFMSFYRWESTMAEKHLSFTEHAMDYPGGKVRYTSDLSFISGSPDERIQCYRVLDENGHIISSSNFIEIGKEVAVKMYMDMVTLQVMDTIFYEAQRQGRISFYLTCIGEEAINIASAAALNFEDLVFPQYREPGVLLWRGFTIQEFANQLFGNDADYGKGKQMPIHYGSNKHNYVTVSSTVGTQIPQAVGAAYSLKMDGKDACSITYFGDGGTSTGDFHAGLNFAAVMEAPVIFFCRNNGWAISTPVADQFRSDGIVIRGQAYGIRSIRVDGHDAVAIYTAVHEARQMAIQEGAPVLIEVILRPLPTEQDTTPLRMTPPNTVQPVKLNGGEAHKTLFLGLGNILKGKVGGALRQSQNFVPKLGSSYPTQYKLQKKARNPLLQTFSEMYTMLSHPTSVNKKGYSEKQSVDIQKIIHLMFLFKIH